MIGLLNMRTKISGEPKNITKKETREIISWLARELCVDRFKTPLDIDVKFRKNLKKRYGYRGSAIWEDDNHRPRMFTIDIDGGLTRRMSLLTLIHEMVHVKQYSKGQLKDLLRHYTLKKWGTKLIDESKVGYWKLPWELEAYRLEEVYYKKWQVYNRKKCQ